MESVWALPKSTKQRGTQAISRKKDEVSQFRKQPLYWESFAMNDLVTVRLIELTQPNYQCSNAVMILSPSPGAEGEALEIFHTVRR